MGPEEPALFVANHLMGGVLTNNPLQSLLAIRDAENMGHPDMIHPPKYLDGQVLETGEEVSDRALLAYKARPLNGIWSGAPYLHNGSVPNLYELLLPAAQRSDTFYIGSWEYDPVRVGYVGPAWVRRFPGRYQPAGQQQCRARIRYRRGRTGAPERCGTMGIAGISEDTVGIFCHRGHRDFMKIIRQFSVSAKRCSTVSCLSLPCGEN